VRLAWFSPWPPQRSGIAGRSAELAAALAARGHRIDVFVDEQDPAVRPLVTHASPDPPQVREVRIQSAHDFVWRAARSQYDLAVYQLGNSRLHEFIWPYLFRWPGLAVLHDARLHHARGRALLRRGRVADYRAEFAWEHDGASIDLAELAVRGFRGPYYYQWPMTRAVVEASRVTACHSRGAADELRERFPERTIEYVALGEGSWRYDVDSMGRRFRAAHRLDPSAVVLGVHGALTAEKRVPEILRAFAATRQPLGGAILLLAGQPDPQLELEQQIAALGLRDVVRLVTNLDDGQFDAAIAATDVCLNLRWPTALETSGPWVRSLAMSRATVVVDLAHQRNLPVLDPRTWRRHKPCEEVSPDADTRAIAVAIDILDEDHSLRLAMRRLVADEALRSQLGHHGRAYWEREHTMVRMIADFERAAVRAVARPAPDTPLPAHMRPDPDKHADALLEPFGLNHEGHEAHEVLLGPK
jgi:glycosyltransferase involved in cell wall biosynthesis